MKKILIVILLTILFSCESNRVYEQNNQMDKRYWLASDSQEFTFEISDSTQYYNLFYNVRNSLDYPVARIFVEYTLADSANSAIKKALTSNYLFDQKTGKPFGESGLGDVFDHQFPIIQKIKFPYSGKYQLTLKQFNREDTLQGVLAVGVRVETIESK